MKHLSHEDGLTTGLVPGRLRDVQGLGFRV